MSSIKLTADSGGGSVSLKAPATTTSNADLEITVPDVATGSSVVTADSSGHVSLADSKELRVGTGDDLKISHDGSNSIINQTGTGTLRIQQDETNHWEFGNSFLKGNDGREIILGDSSDLKIYHSGTHSYIKNTHASGYTHLQVNDGDAGIKILPNDAVELYCNDARKLETTSGGITVTGSVTETSDETLKENIVTLTNAVDTIKQIKGVSFNWKDAAYGGKAIGVIAQDVEKVYPDLVIDREDKETKVTTKTLNYAGLIGPLVECIKELDARIKTLEAA